MSTLPDSFSLQTELQQNPGTVLLDVQPEDIFALAHLPEAKNACVYNVTFLDDCARLIPQKTIRIVVHASSARSRASAVAVEKLRAAGYSQVQEFPGGLEAWAAAGLPVEAGAGSESPILLESRVFLVDTVASLIRWSGRNFNSTHTGTMRLVSGEITVARHSVSGARFVIDLLSMQNDDLPDEGMRRVLIAHLCSDDFFNTARQPQGELWIERATPIRGAAENQPNFLLSGSLTLNDVAAPLSFPATVHLAAAGDLTASATLEIDRTRWGINYGSNRFYEKIGKHFVSDLIQLSITIQAR